MRKSIKVILILIVQLLVVSCMQPSIPPVIQTTAPEKKSYIYNIYSAENLHYDIDIESIKNSFKKNNLEILSSRDMNNPLRDRYGKVNFKSYYLLMYRNSNIAYKLLKKYPKFALFFSMKIPIWLDNDRVFVAQFTHEYIAKMSGIPLDNKDLLLYMQSVNHAIMSALPNARKSSFRSAIQNDDKNIEISYPITILKIETSLDYIGDYEAEFEGELEKYGVKVPYYNDVLSYKEKEQLCVEFDFFHIYSLEKLSVLNEISNKYPQSGLTLPLTFYIYKKSANNRIYIGYMSPNSMITLFDIKEKNVLERLKNYSNILKETTEYLKE